MQLLLQKGHKEADCRTKQWDNANNVEEEFVMHILYHLPTEYNNINDQYLKDLDDGKDVNLENLRADLRRKYDRLVDSGRIDKNNDD